MVKLKELLTDAEQQQLKKSFVHEIDQEKYVKDLTLEELKNIAFVIIHERPTEMTLLSSYSSTELICRALSKNKPVFN